MQEYFALPFVPITETVVTHAELLTATDVRIYGTSVHTTRTLSPLRILDLQYNHRQPIIGLLRHRRSEYPLVLRIDGTVADHQGRYLRLWNPTDFS